MTRYDSTNEGRSKIVAAAPLLVLALAAALVLSYVQPFAPSVPEGGPGQVMKIVSPSEAAGLIDSTPDMVILDLRTPAEHARSRIPDSRLMDYHDADFWERLDSLDRDIPYLLYCATHGRSAQTMERMAGQGFTRVWLLQGGIYAWRNAGLPVER